MALKIILITIGAVIFILILLRIIRKSYHFPTPRYIGYILGSDLRRFFQPPGTITERSGIKPGGILAVTEFFPDPDYPFRSTVIKTGKREGFSLDGSQGNFWNYTVRFKKPLADWRKD